MANLCKNCAKINIEDLCIAPDYHDELYLRFDHRDKQYDDASKALVAKDCIQLEKSADRGCRFCAFIYQCITTCGKPGDMELMVTQPVYLTITWGGGWEINRYEELSPKIEWPKIHLMPWKIDLIDDRYIRPYKFLQPRTIRPLSADPCSEGNIAQVKRWISRCQERHESCCAHKSEEIPHRLIDVSCDLPASQLRLVDTTLDKSKDLQAFGKYLALSYSWGSKSKRNPHSHISTKGNVTKDDRLKSFELDTLPQTIKDAVIFTRALGYRYLWVDSLCILQDDDEDKARNIGRMQHVYKNAACTLSAIESKQASEGILFPREYVKYHAYRVKIPLGSRRQKARGVSRLLQTVSGQKEAEKPSIMPPDCVDICGDYTHALPLYTFSSAVQDSYLETRGWVFQERLLSPRRLCISKWGLFFECHEFAASETNPDGFEERKRSGTLMRYFHHERHRILPHPGQDWRELMVDASNCYFTNPDDGLRSLEGIAQEYKHRKAPDDEYLAGLWRSGIIFDLTWIGEAWTVRTSSRELYEQRIARLPFALPYYQVVPPDWDPNQPTWSWVAQRRREVKWPDWHPGDEPELLTEYVSHNMTPVSNDNPCGNVVRGLLVLRGRLCRIELGNFKHLHPYQTQSWHRDYDPRRMWLDVPNHRLVGSICCLPLLTMRVPEYNLANLRGRPPATNWGLLLERNGRDGWRRVGLCQTESEEDFLDRSSESQLVTLS